MWWKQLFATWVLLTVETLGCFDFILRFPPSDWKGFLTRRLLHVHFCKHAHFVHIEQFIRRAGQPRDGRVGFSGIQRSSSRLKFKKKKKVKINAVGAVTSFMLNDTLSWCLNAAQHSRSSHPPPAEECKRNARLSLSSVSALTALSSGRRARARARARACSTHALSPPFFCKAHPHCGGSKYA